MSARATHLKAAIGNVSVATIERKQMSNKTTYKRIALAVVAALGFGVLASGPSNAAVQSGATLSISGATASIKAGETATATLTATFTGINGFSPNYDSMSVTYVRTTGTSNGGATVNFAGSAIDTASVKAYGAGSASAWADGDTSSAVTAKFKFDFVMPTTAGTYGYTFYPAFNNAATGVTPPAPVTFTITVAAANTKPAATQSSIYIGTWANQPQATANLTDSAIVATAGTIGTPVAVGYITWVQRNSDSSTSVVVKESVTAVIDGAGLLNVNGNGVNGAKAGAVTAEAGETITVWSDGRTGTATIKFTTTSMTTWASKTVTFFGTATKASLVAVRPKVSKVGADSAVALRVTLSDASDKVVTTATNIYVHSSDTKVVNNGLCSVTVSASLGYGTCSLSGLVGDTGTAKIKVANYAFESSTTVAAAGYVAPQEVTIQVVGAARQVKATFDKASYTPGEKSTVTLVATDTWGAVVDTQTITGALLAGLDFNVGTDVSDTVITFSSGVKTFSYVMPTNGQTVTLDYQGGAGLVGSQSADSVSALVIDPAEEAANSALDAAQEATDAAIAATDAAILAQEAADEAASAAIAAQETAQAAVDAVTALSAEVTKLVAQLATLQKLLNRVAKRVGVKL